MKKDKNTLLDRIAKENGYKDSHDLLFDYDFSPWSRLKPKHKKIDLIKLIYNHIKKGK